MGSDCHGPEGSKGHRAAGRGGRLYGDQRSGRSEKLGEVEAVPSDDNILPY